ncbi:MAG: lipid A biosynthesis acyltransferase [Ferrovum sp.]|nr:lipid A biosynthesis acyltransferase [Ferrovum sp.]
MKTRLTLWFLWWIHWLPLRGIAALAAILGFIAAKSRGARTTRINIHACFPELSPPEKDTLVRRHLTALIQSVLELGILWWSPAQRIQRLVRFKNVHHAQDSDRPIICLSLHTVGLEMQGALIGMHFRGVGFFTPHKDPLIDEKLRASRDRLGDVLMLERKKGLRPLVRAIRDGRLLFFLPDMDFGERDSHFVPFFGIPAATVPTLPWLVRQTEARVIPCACHRLPHHQGYEVEFFAPWDDFPSADLEQDLRRMNQFIEEQARRYPEEYYWSHKRFRTRPHPDEPYFYRWPQDLG